MSNTHTTTKRRKKVPVFIRQTASWLCRGMKSAFWYLLLGVILSAVLFTDPLFTDCKEREIRWVGLILQSTGFCFVAWQLNKLGKLFKLPSVISRIKKYVNKFPSLFNKDIRLASDFSGVITAGSPKVEIHLKPGQNATLERRVKILENAVDGLRNNLNEAHVTLSKYKTENKIALEKLRSDTTEELRKIERLINEAIVGEIQLDWIGIFYFVAGTILASGSPELTSLLGHQLRCAPVMVG